MVAMVVTVVAHPLERLNSQPPMGMGAAVGLWSSINSSFDPPGPIVRNSLITILVAGDNSVLVIVGVNVRVGVVVWVGVVVTVGVTVSVGVMVVVGVVVTVGVGVRVGRITPHKLSGDVEF
jgi:hypothetical protein